MFNLQDAEKTIKISHPLVRDSYIKKERFADGHHEDVLVIEAKSDQADLELNGFDSYLYDLVIHLQDLKEQAENQNQSIDRIDICSH